ncbi:MAG: class I SAM-dependent methyltransferase, partial [Candidatus Izemoplasma sp.]
KVTIIDSLNKRIKFLDVLCKELDIDVTLIHGRAEEHKFKNSYDLVTARAVARLNILSELCIPFVKKDGYFLALKGPNYNEELKDALSAFKTLNSSVEDIYKYEISGLKRSLLIIKKNKDSASKYPRQFGKIKANPL